MENVIAVGLSAALGQKVVIGKTGTDNLVNTQINTIHNFSLLWRTQAIHHLGRCINPETRNNNSACFYVATKWRTAAVESLQSSTIEEFKQKIQETERIPSDQQKLSFHGQQLEDGKTLLDYDIKEGSTVNLELSQKIQIYVKTLIGKMIEIDVELSDTVDKCKGIIQDKEGLQPDEQYLYFMGQLLENNRTLSQYKIQKGSTLHLIIQQLKVLNIPKDNMDPKYDFQYEKKPLVRKDSHQRGGQTFQRPYGWTKTAIKVLGKYESDDWLGVSAPVNRTHDTVGEWPVSYHGTCENFADDITTEGFELRRGKRFKFGRGIYSAPDPNVAALYSPPFEVDGIEYKLLFMNRVNPEYTRVVREEGIGIYYVTSDDTQIRPYAILTKRNNEKATGCFLM